MGHRAARRNMLVAATVVLCALPRTVWADISETTVLQAGNVLSLETGAIGSSGADILWNGSTIAPQGGARVNNLGNLGYAGFSVLGQALVALETPDARATPIAANLLVPGDVFVVASSSGRPAKVLVTANTGGMITVRFTTFGVTAPAGVPLVTDVFNNSSQIAPGLPGFGIAPSSLFIIRGVSLADPGEPVLQSSADPGLPTSLNGASIAVTVNGVTTTPPLYYTSPRQLAAVLPAATRTGTGTFTVTYRGRTSAPSPILVVPSAVGINNYLGDLGVVTDGATGALLTFTNSGAPGQAIVIWSTGLGANPADSDSLFAATPHSVDTPLRVIIGGAPATVLYQGSAGYPGVNQINVLIPTGTISGCWVPLVAITGSVVSNVVTIPINPGGGACVDAASGLSGTQISPSGGQTLRTGLISLVQANSTNRNGTPNVTNSANGAFVRYTGLYAPQYSLSPGGCLVNPTAPPVPAVTFLEAGVITMTGPNGANVTLGNPLGVRGQFFANLGANGIPATGGSFTFRGAGGADVGSFTTTLTLANPILNWSNRTALATVDRNQGAPISWTGGNPGSYVLISGGSNSGAGVTGSYTCMTAADARQFTVPAYVLQSIPAGNGNITVQNSITAPLAATGLDIATAIAAISFSSATVYQ